MPTSIHHPVRLSDDELLRQCAVRHTRRRGPGGQHRNKTESAVVIRHEPTGLEGQAAERRSQADNHRNAVSRLRMTLAVKIRCPEDGAAAPSDLWQSRCHNEKIACSDTHEDFPLLIAEALDVIDQRQGNLTSSAEQLGCTPSQLLKFLGKEPTAILSLNELRRRSGLPPRTV